MNHMKKALAVFGILVAGLVAGRGYLHAQCDPLNPPPGQPYRAYFSDAQMIFIDAWQNIVAASARGEIQLLANGNGSLPCQTNLAMQYMGIDIDLPGLGSIRVEIDARRPYCSLSVIANQMAPPLPATATMSSYLVASTSFSPGEIYYSENAMNCSNRNIMRFPFTEQPFRFTERVKFVNARRPSDFFFIDMHEIRLTLI